MRQQVGCGPLHQLGAVLGIIDHAADEPDPGEHQLPMDFVAGRREDRLGSPPCGFGSFEISLVGEQQPVDLFPAAAFGGAQLLIDLAVSGQPVPKRLRSRQIAPPELALRHREHVRHGRVGRKVHSLRGSAWAPACRRACSRAAVGDRGR